VQSSAVKTRSADVPRISAADQPKRRSARAFHSVTRPAQFIATIANSIALSRIIRWRFGDCAQLRDSGFELGFASEQAIDVGLVPRRLCVG
jgi:hypothetical protein